MCGVSLASTFFSLAKKGSSMCVCCDSDATKRRIAAAVPPAEPPKEKRCTRCGIIKASQEFYSNRGSSNGLQASASLVAHSLGGRIGDRRRSARAGGGAAAHQVLPRVRPGEASCSLLQRPYQ